MQSISNPTKDIEALGTSVSLADSISNRFKEMAVEMADMSFDELDRCAELIEELLEARTLARVVEIETDYLKCCRRAFAQSALHLCNLCVAIGEDMTKPLTGGHPAPPAPGKRSRGRARSENERHFPRPGSHRDGSAARKSRAARAAPLRPVAAER